MYLLYAYFSILRDLRKRSFWLESVENQHYNIGDLLLEIFVFNLKQHFISFLFDWSIIDFELQKLELGCWNINARPDTLEWLTLSKTPIGALELMWVRWGFWRNECNEKLWKWNHIAMPSVWLICPRLSTRTSKTHCRWRFFYYRECYRKRPVLLIEKPGTTWFHHNQYLKLNNWHWHWINKCFLSYSGTTKSFSIQNGCTAS